MIRPQEIGYADELLADGTVHRRYEDGLEEWRSRTADRPHLVNWRDNRGGSGTDELLGNRLIKRTLADGTPLYARDIGYGRTVWPRGERVTVNRSSFGGRMGVLLAGLGVAALAVTAAHLPPLIMSPEEEEELRRQQAASSSSGGDGGGAAGGDSGDDSWEDGWGGDEDAWSDDDFG
ncbi:hypothetical protein [Streptomyces sp. NPDC096339]|uniref:hypothetical protein n=1 Tax=Streptomyces sp. NPDC096339 TaxID=3366086 RepID=UPI0037F92F96